MNKKFVILFSVIGLLMLPVFIVSGIQIPPEPTGNIQDVARMVNSILYLMWQVFLTISFILLFASAFMFLTAQGDEGKLTTARQAIIWAVVSFIVAVTSFSIPNILRSILTFAGA